MQEHISVEGLFDEAMLLSVEDRNRLTDMLIGQRQRDTEESTIYKVEELDDGRILKYHRVRPEDRRRKDGERFDLFMGRLKFCYYPPDTMNDIRQQLEQWAGFSGLKDPERKILVGTIIEEMALELFWELPQRYENMIRDAESDLRCKVESELLAKMGIKLETISNDGGILIIKKDEGGALLRQSKKKYNPKHRPKDSRSFNEDSFLLDLEETILRLEKETAPNNFSQPKVAENLKRHKSEFDVMRKRWKRCPIEKRGGDLEWPDYVKYVLKKAKRHVDKK